MYSKAPSHSSIYSIQKLRNIMKQIHSCVPFALNFYESNIVAFLDHKKGEKDQLNKYLKENLTYE